MPTMKNPAAALQPGGGRLDLDRVGSLCRERAADAIEHEPAPKVEVGYRDRGPEQPTTKRDLAKWCRHSDAGRLKPHEPRFVHSITACFFCGGKQTGKQAA